ncbi:MAG: nitrogenase component 1 [Thermoguttaceae bacterium]|jgi:nitrogenase molybdenum-iron protein NifN
MIDIVAQPKAKPKSATRNACRLCAPLGACLAFRGVEGAMPLLHGSQGCATYIRRYMISHFREPLDIASSNFSEESAIFGGRQNLRTALENVVRQYAPSLIGIATTCLAETIGDDVSMYLHEIAAEGRGTLPEVVHVSTPSYSAGHEEGYHATVTALVEALAKEGPRHEAINVIAPMGSPADLRCLKTVFRDFGLEPILLPDYSDTLDGPAWTEYHPIPPGGAPIDSIRRMGSARATVEFGSAWHEGRTPGKLLEERFGVPRHALPLPLGVTQSDRLFEVLQELSGRPIPASCDAQRGRLVDSYVDAHKYVFGKRAVVYGEQDLVVGIAALLAEIGVTPALCASGTATGRLREQLAAVEADLAGDIVVLEDVDFAEIEEHAARLQPDLVIGSSKGYSLSRRLKVPLVRVGFPIHDRMDGPRLLHLGYGGAQQLFDRIAAALVGASQDASPVGYSYM